MTLRETLIIPDRLVRREIPMKDVLAAVEEAFVAYATGQAVMPPKVYLDFDHGDLRCMPGHIRSKKVAGVKIVNAHSANAELQLPAVMATYLLVDPDSGFPLAVIGATWLTALRTGAAGGLSSRALARPDARVLGLLGTGVQAQTQLLAHMITMPNLREVHAASPNDEDNRRLREAFLPRLRAMGVRWVAAGSNRDVAKAADVLVTTTPSHRPIVAAADIEAGTHIAAMGADAPGKRELPTELLQHARIFVDDMTQASHSGEINVPLQQREIRRDSIAGTLGDLLAGKILGRLSDSDITLFDSTGLAIQDAAVARLVYDKLEKHPETLKLPLVVSEE